MQRSNALHSVAAIGQLATPLCALAAVQRKWTKTVVSASGGSMGVEFVESRAACGCCYAPIESSPSTECRPVSLMRLGRRLTYYHALSTRRMGRATLVLCAHLRRYSSCFRRNDAATRSAVAVLSMQPAQVPPQETRAAASPATGPFDTRPTGLDSGRDWLLLAATACKGQCVDSGLRLAVTGFDWRRAVR